MQICILIIYCVKNIFGMKKKLSDRYSHVIKYKLYHEKITMNYI